MPSPIEILAIADDATGALEVGGQLAAEGIRALVTTRSEFTPVAGGLVVDAETRHLEPGEAALSVRHLACAARDAGIQHIYKKTDSTLRGNIPAELQALLEVFPDRVLVYVPAYPKMKRMVSEGEVFVDGRPLAEWGSGRHGSVPELLRGVCRGTIHIARDAGELGALLKNAANGAVIVCDGRTGADLRDTAEALAGSGRACLLAGTGGFVGEWVRRIAVRRDRTAPEPIRVERCLVASGSMHAASRAQIRHAHEAGLPVHHLDEQPDTSVARSLTATDWAAVATPGDCLSGVSSRIGGIVREALRTRPVDALVVFGGSTALAILAALGVNSIESLGELLPGIPLSQVTTAGRRVLLVTKAGGFGDPETLVSIRRLLEEYR